MTTEQKAKAYEEAIEKFGVILNLNTVKERGIISADDVRKIFPELNESDEERFKNYIIDCCKETIKADDRGLELSMETTKKLLTWLEKQKEFVSADFDDVWETADCDELTAPLEKYSKDAIKEMCHAWYDKGIELERKNWLGKQGEQILANSAKTCKDEQKSAEWSDVDNYMLYETIQHLELLIAMDKVKHFGDYVQYYQRDIDWLKSLKDRV